MGAAARDGRVADYGFAAEAFFSVAAVDPMALLEFSFAAIDSLIVVNRRAFEADGFLQNFLHCAMQAARFRVGQLAAGFLWMDFCAPQRLVGIDIAHPADHALIEQQRLDVGVARLDSRAKFFFGDFERLEAQAAELGFLFRVR